MTDPVLIEAPPVTVKRLRTMYAVVVRGTQVSILPTASGAAELAERLRGNPTEAAELEAFALREFSSGRKR